MHFNLAYQNNGRFVLRHQEQIEIQLYQGSRASSGVMSLRLFDHAIWSRQSTGFGEIMYCSQISCRVCRSCLNPQASQSARHTKAQSSKTIPNSATSVIKGNHDGGHSGNAHDTMCPREVIVLCEAKPWILKPVLDGNVSRVFSAASLLDSENFKTRTGIVTGNTLVWLTRAAVALSIGMDSPGRRSLCEFWKQMFIQRCLRKRQSQAEVMFLDCGKISLLDFVWVCALSDLMSHLLGNLNGLIPFLQ